MDNQYKKKMILLNTSVGAAVAVFNLVMSFISRSVFIYFLGSQLLGVNGLFTSLISMLSLAELGIGTSIVYFLYQPLAEGNFARVSAFMSLYKKVYTYIAFVVAVIGIALMPFLQHIVHSNRVTHTQILMYYSLFLLNAVVSYLFTYNRSLLLADQKNYLVVTIDSVFKFVLQVLQIVVLALSGSFLMYLILQVLNTIGANLVITKYVQKRYKGMLGAKEQIDDASILKLKRNVVGNFANKIGDVAVNGMDNVFISLFVSISSVGLYSNYVMIVNAMQTVLLTITSSMTATIGHIVSISPETEGWLAFQKHRFFNFTLAYFSGAAFFSVVNDFVRIWLGDKYVLNLTLITLLTLTYFVNRMRNTASVFLDAFGLAWQQRFKPIIEAGLNLLLSITFMKFFHMGIEGVVLSTLFTSFFFASIFEATIVFKHGLRKSMRFFFAPYFVFLVAFVITIGITAMMMNVLTVKSDILTLVIHLVFGMTLASAIYALFFSREENLTYVISTLKNKFGRR